MKKPLIIIFLVLLFDQALKIWVKTHMTIGEHINILGEKFQIYFIENNGMAFGMELGEFDYSKIALSLIRIVFVTGIAYYLYKFTRKKGMPNGLIVSMSLIFAGAIGNIIDSMFYGLIFNESPIGIGEPAHFMPVEGGYAGFLHGRVVDMLYFPLFTTHLPDWFPVWGGEDFSFFSAIFNISDSAITIGVFMMLIWQKRYFRKYAEITEPAAATAAQPVNTVEENKDEARPE